MDTQRKNAILETMRGIIIDKGEFVPQAFLVSLTSGPGGQLDQAAEALLDYFSKLSPLT